jgi:H+-transporting ATPase
MASNSSDTPPNHLGTSVPTGGLEGHQEKIIQESGAPEALPEHEKDVAPAADDEEEEEEEDIDALIDDLESQDGHANDDDEEENVAPGTGRIVPEDREFN